VAVASAGGHMQVCTSLQTDNHASTPPLSFLQAGCPSCRSTKQRQSTEGSNKAIFTTQHFASVYNVVMFLNFYRPISQLQQFTGN